MIPVLNPAGVQEFLDLGLHGFAMSRFSGCWTGFKCVTMTVDSSASVYVDPHRVDIKIPDNFGMPDGGLNIRWPDVQLEQEVRLHNFKLLAAQAYVRTNRLDRIVINSGPAKLGLVAAGKSYLDVRQALADLELDESDLVRLGVRLYKPALVWPLEPEGLREFATGLDEIIVVEEKRGLIEDQIKELLYNSPKRPKVIVGKTDEEGEVLFPSTYQ
ncbi:MAG TPA: indolepyruvate ferredoxin oxidoreductase family protein, partial [Alphaproteobacteria bacterium]|nr:indolepyruvate ferredoxin oxidoreductase family protein [Alphaproteobacteria bacterium]